MGLKMILRKTLYKLLDNAFYRKTMQNVRYRLRLEYVGNYKYTKIIKQQSKLTFSGIRKSDEYCDSYSFRQNEVKMDKPIFLGFAVLEVSKLHMYETYYDKLQPFFGGEKIQFLYVDTDALF